METFIIKRSKWARGGKNGTSALRNRQGNMCCLGFFCLALGVKEDELGGEVSPDHLVSCANSNAMKFKRLFRGLVAGSYHSPRATLLADDIMECNDNQVDYAEGARESRLTKLFAKLGWKPKFID